MELLALGAYLHDGQALFKQLHDIWIPNIIHLLKIYFRPFGNFDGFTVEVKRTGAFLLFTQKTGFLIMN